MVWPVHASGIVVIRGCSSFSLSSYPSSSSQLLDQPRRPLQGPRRRAGKDAEQQRKRREARGEGGLCLYRHAFASVVCRVSRRVLSSSIGPAGSFFLPPFLPPLALSLLQINVANVDANGVYTQGDFKTIALAGYIRAKGEADSALTELVKKADSEQ